MNNLIQKEQVSSHTLDHLGLVVSTIEKLGLIEKIDARIPVSENKGAKITMGQRVASMIINGLGFIDNRLYMHAEFLDNKPVKRFFGENITADMFNDDALGRALDAIYNYGVTKLFSDIAFEIGIEQQLIGKTARFDTTTLTVYGQYDKEDKKQKEGDDFQITYGYAKNKRFDLKQVVLNMATTGAAAFPVWMEAHSGNASDKVTLQAAAKSMHNFCKLLEETPSFLYVGDSAMYEKCVEKAGDMLWLSRVPQTILEAKKRIQQKDYSWITLDNEYKIHSFNVTYKDVPQRWLLVFSPQAYDREIQTLEKNIQKEYEEQTKAVWHLSTKDFQCKQDALKAIEPLRKALKYHTLSTEVAEVKKYKKKGKPKKDTQPDHIVYAVKGVLQKDLERIEAKKLEKGRFILATNQLDTKELSDEQMLIEYKNQIKTEAGFRFIKGNAFEVSSVFLKKPTRIQALMMVMTLCLMVYSSAEYFLRQSLKKYGETIPNQLKKPIKNPSMDWIFRIFQGIHVLYIKSQIDVQEIVLNVKDLAKTIIKHFGQRAAIIYGIETG